MTTTTDQQVPKILSAINSIMASIEPIAKNKVNQHHDYKFRGVDDVYAVLNPMLVANKVVIIPEVTNITTEQFTSSKGTLTFRSVVTMKYSVLHSEDASVVEVVIIGEGMDTGDKATNKAMSTAYKYMAFQLFCIPVDTGDDSEHDDHTLTGKNNAPQPTKSAEPTKWLNKLKKDGSFTEEWSNLIRGIEIGTVTSVADVAKYYKLSKETRSEIEALLK